MHDRYLVLTPEKVVVSLQLAGINSRIGAHLIDLFIAGVGLYILAILLSLITLPLGMGAMQLVIGVVFAFGLFAYFILLESLWQGQTLGKRLLRLRVTMVDGTPVTFGAAFWRNILRLADILPSFYLVGFVAIFTNARSQRMGDLVAGTVVIRYSTPAEFTFAPHRVGIHPLEHTVGDLLNMTLEEYHAIKRLCDRFPMLPPAEQNKNIESIWMPFIETHKISPAHQVHPIYQMEAVVMKYGRIHKLV